MAQDKKWIQDAIKHTGILTARAKKEGKLNQDGTIDTAWLEAVAKEPAPWGPRARLALNMRKMH